MTQQEFYKRYSYDAKSDKLGGGGFARVFKAWDSVEDCYVALKIQPVGINPDLRLRKEVECATELHHPNIARYKACYTFDTFDGETDIAVMSYYEHGSLDKLLRSQRLTDEEREDILTQILDGISFLHSHGIIHRDLKPQNILVLHHGGRYVPKITDFGISKQLDDGVSSVVHNSVVGGTYAYASPEQLQETTIRKNTDLWSFGVIAYQMFVGVLPFNCGKFSPTSQDGHSEQLRQMTSGVLPEALNNIPEPWQRLIRQCLVVDNTQRLNHVEDCMAIIGIQPVAIEKPVEVKSTDERTIPEKQPKYDNRSNHKSRWWLWLLITILFLAIGGAVGYLMLGNDTPEPTPKAVVQEELDIEESSAEEPIALAEPVPDPTFTLDKSSLTVDSSGGSHSVSYTIENPIDWESVSVSVIDNQQWITNPSASGGKITFKTTDNTSTESRTGTITAIYNGITRQITVTQKGADPININGHTAVDLGLSVKWATCNVGATSPEGYGNYYAWGETTTKTSYTWDNYQHWVDYDGDGHLDDGEFTINTDISGTQYDAARANWGGSWRLPTKSEFDELRYKCTWTWTKLNGVDGYEVKSKKNGNSIFLPAAGWYYDDTPNYEEPPGTYYSSTPKDNTSGAYALFFGSGGHGTDLGIRYYGDSVRPVAE